MGKLLREVRSPECIPIVWKPPLDLADLWELGVINLTASEGAFGFRGLWGRSRGSWLLVRQCGFGKEQEVTRNCPMSEDLARQPFGDCPAPSRAKKTDGEGRIAKTEGNVCGDQDQGPPGPLVPCWLSLKGPASCPFSPSPLPRSHEGQAQQLPEIAALNLQGLTSRVRAWRTLLNPFWHFWKEFRVNSFPVGRSPAQRNPGCKSWAIIHKLKAPG